MSYDDCQRFLDDPEANEEHLQGCESCRALVDTLGDSPEARPLSVGVLPMASWEGATHRSWPLLIAAAIAIGAAALGLIVMIGTTPSELFRGRVPTADVLMSLVTMAGGAVQNAPRVWQVVIVIAFVVINAIFAMLLRRSPKGLDV